MIELGFIHGRFQLFHNDHLNYALLAKAQCKKLIVGITSPENATLIREDIDPHRSEAASNPFTYYERFNMVKLALLEAGIPREDFEITPYPIERPEIRTWFAGGEGWLMNIIGLRENRSCFVCGDPYYQRQLERVFGVRFEGDTALTAAPYLRKQIIKKAYF